MRFEILVRSRQLQ